MEIFMAIVFGLIISTAEVRPIHESQPLISWQDTEQNQYLFKNPITKDIYIVDEE